MFSAVEPHSRELNSNSALILRLTLAEQVALESKGVVIGSVGERVLRSSTVSTESKCVGKP